MNTQPFQNLVSAYRPFELMDHTVQTAFDLLTGQHEALTSDYWRKWADKQYMQYMTFRDLLEEEEKRRKETDQAARKLYRDALEVLNEVMEGAAVSEKDLSALIKQLKALED